MARRSSLLTVLLVLVTLVGGALVGAATGIALETSVAHPAVPKALGAPCVAEPAVMRRAHPDMLKHGRDVVLRSGDRSSPVGLAGCIGCHAVKDETGAAVSVSSPRHFCRSCHDYAAVKIDCFECHASRPEPGKGAALDGGPAAFAGLADPHAVADLAAFAATRRPEETAR